MSPRETSRHGSVHSTDATTQGRKAQRKPKPSELRRKIRRLEARLSAVRADSGVDLDVLLGELKTARVDLTAATERVYAAARKGRGLTPFRGHTTRPYTQPAKPSETSTSGRWPTRRPRASE